MSALGELSFTVSYFPTAFPSGPAFGTEATTTWKTFADQICCGRREGDKDGRGFVPARFRLEPDGQVRRIKTGLVARTAIVLDIETNKQTGETPPHVAAAVARIKDQNWAAIIYTSHSHSPEAPRYRIVLPLSVEIAPDLPAAELVAGLLGLLGTMDRTKISAASLFYLPSSRPGDVDHHEVVEVVGAPIFAAWMQERANAIVAEREAERARQRAEALEVATARREERARHGVDPDTSIIEAVRHRLDLAGELIGYGYLRVGEGRYLYPGSESGVAGVYVMTGRDGVERVFSHHSADPLAAINLPSWCRAKAIDVVDVVTILGHSGDQKAALRSLAVRFGVNREAGPRRTPPHVSAKPAASAPSLLVLTAEELLCLEFTQRAMVLHPILPEKGLGMIYGPRGIGKTHLTLGIAYAISTGTSFLRWQAPKARRVLIIDGEMPAVVLQERLARIADAVTCEPPDASYLRLLFLDMQTDRSLDLSSDADQQDLEKVIGDAEVILIDNISTLVHGGRENEAESWLPVQLWALQQRRAGRCVLFIHHAGKGGQQRGTSRREDVLDTVVSLRLPSDHNPDQGARFEVHYEKSRGFHGDDAMPFEATLGAGGWTTRDLADVDMALVVKLTGEGLSVRDIADETGIKRSTVNRMQKKARDLGLLGRAADA